MSAINEQRSEEADFSEELPEAVGERLFHLLIIFEGPEKNQVRVLSSELLK